MKKTLLLFTLLLPLMLHAQTFVTEKDSLSNETLLKGPCRYADLLDQPAFGWMADASRYRPDAGAIARLQKMLPAYHLIVFFGSWCSDSHLQLPHLYKVLQEAQMPMEKVQLYGLDRAKKGLDEAEKKYDITRVPTVILLKGETELGRIVETPQKSLEADLAAIIEGKQ